MRTREDLQLLFEVARENECPWIEVDGVKMAVPKKQAQSLQDPVTPNIPSDPSAEYSDDEILFYSTPYFDELQALKEEKKKREDDEVRS